MGCNSMKYVDFAYYLPVHQAPVCSSRVIRKMCDDEQQFALYMHGPTGQKNIVNCEL